MVIASPQPRRIGSLSRSGVAWKPGPTIARIVAGMDRHQGSVPPWHRYDPHELPWHRPEMLGTVIRRIG